MRSGVARFCPTGLHAYGDHRGDRREYPASEPQWRPPQRKRQHDQPAHDGGAIAGELLVTVAWKVLVLAELEQLLRWNAVTEHQAAIRAHRISEGAERLSRDDPELEPLPR